ncbi:MAG: homing endonuclease associated repeat-containing protein [Gemmatimonadaceae bacterium]
MSIADLATATGFTGRTCSVCLRALGLLDAACRLLRWRRRSREKARIVAALRKAAESLGRTPKVHEGGGSPAQGSAVAAFGSWRNAVVAAGLIPRDRGKTTCLNQAAA